MLDVEPVGFRAVSYLPDGAHRRAHVDALPRGDGRLRGHRLPGRRARSPPTRGRSARRSCSACRGCGRRSTPACRPPSGPTRRRRRSSTRPSRPPSRSRSGARSAPPPRRTTPPTQFLDEVAFAGVRALVGLDAVEYAISGAAPIPAELISWYRAIGVPLSEIYGMSESTGPDDLGAHAGEGRHRRRGLPGHRLLPRRRRRGVHPGRQRLPRLPRRPREDRRGARPRRHAALRRHRRVRRRGLPADHRPQEGAHHHRRREEHQPGQPRGRAEDDPAGRPGVRDRRPEAVRVGARGARRRGRAGVGQGPRHRVRARSPSWPSTPT